MTGRRRLDLGILTIAVNLLMTAAPLWAEEKPTAAAPPAPPSASVRIGMAGSLFRDLPEQMVLVLMKPFGSMMQSQTGVSGELIPIKTIDELGKQLAEDKVQLGVFHGFEFAWARQKHTNLQPLMIAVNQDRHLRALLVVRADCAAADLAQLKGQTLGMHFQTREHCRLFLDRDCQRLGLEPREIFAKTTTPPNAEDALDDVVDNLVQATVVENIAFDCYKRRKPGRFAKLKVLKESAIFPAGVVAYRPGALDEATLKKFRDGMVNAGTTALGRQLMTLWKLTSFERIPDDYEQTLVNIVKAYPPPPPSQK